MKKTSIYIVSILSISFFVLQAFKTNHVHSLDHLNNISADSAVKALHDDTVLMYTTHGFIKLRLYKETPLHQANFIKLCKQGFYDSLLFHRVIRDFMIQGGDPTSKNAAPNVQLGSGGPNYTIPAEFRFNLRHKRGALAAARMGDQVNPLKASSGSQFYICHKDANFLDNNYTVFGEVIEGLDVVDKIATAPTNHSDRPIQDIKILGTQILSKQ
jgi:cyclophilin family peptidyl-prolyl cis-trans isomerase